MENLTVLSIISVSLLIIGYAIKLAVLLISGGTH